MQIVKSNIVDTNISRPGQLQAVEEAGGEAKEKTLSIRAEFMKEIVRHFRGEEGEMLVKWTRSYSGGRECDDSKAWWTFLWSKL